MEWSRKGALLMLVVALLWSALPAAACLPAMQPSGQPACCRGMVPDCPMQGMNMGNSCCQIRPQNAAVTPDLPFSPEHLQKLVFVCHQASPGAFAIPGVLTLNMIESPPPDLSPGTSSILRI